MLGYRSGVRLLACSVAALLLLSLATPAQAKEKEFKGKVQIVGRGRMYSWFRIDPKGRPMSVGVSLDAACLNSLSDTAEQWVLPLPQEAVAATGIDHVGINWNPMGHLPPGIYDKPHFDFHFYLENERERAEFTSEDAAARAPEADLVPAGYVMAPGSFENGQGMHFADLESGEFHGRGFGHSFIFGFYDGRMTFMEPMVSMDYLRSQDSDYGEVHQPQVYPRQGMYFPHGYSVTYDKKHKRYLIALHDFAQH